MSILESSTYALDSTRKWRTWTTNREQVFEEMLAGYRGHKAHFLEIGSFEGASAIWTLENVLTHPRSSLTCVDNNGLGRGRRLIQNLQTSGHASKVKVLWADSCDLRKHVADNAYDFVYVDGCHEAPVVLQDVLNAYLVCKPGGLVGCDDYVYTRLENGSRPMEAIDAFLAIFAKRIEIVHREKQLWFRKVRD